MKKFFLLSFALVVAASLPFAAIAADGQDVYKKTCAGCHGQMGEKDGGGGALKDLSAADTLTKLKGYADGSYGGDKKAMMQRIAKKLSADDMKAVSDYVGTL